MIKKENKTIRITLDPETNELLESLAQAYYKSKTEIIKVALRILAKSGKKPHYITIGFFEPKEIKKQIKEEPKKESSEEITQSYEELIKFYEEEEKEPSGELPFSL